ncbi:MAG: HAD family phosphatase [Firmicutes bacterium]|nr:HAD family phosphatase [Bacillota bacterium]
MIKKETLYGIRIIAADLDGTLLDADGMLSQRTEGALIRAQEKGFHIVASTGRALHTIPDFIKKTRGMTFMVTGNGARIVRLPSEETIYESLMTKEDTARIMPWISDKSYLVEVFSEGKVYIDQRCMDDLAGFGITSPWSQHYRRTTRIPVPDCIDIVRKAPDRIENVNIMIADEERRLEIAAQLEKLPGLNIVSSAAHNIAIGSCRTSKAEGLRFTAGLYGLGLENIIAFGDSTNDREMIARCGIGVAMGNAADEVKMAADLVALPNTEDGVARMLEELLGI